MHTYALVHALSGPLGDSIGLSKSNIYVITRRFEKQGLVSVSHEKAGAYPARRIYTVTTAGEAAFQKRLGACLSAHYPELDLLSILLIQLDFASS